MPTIVTSNHHDRPFRYRYEVPPEVLADRFGHLPDECDGFLCYHGTWFHLSDFMRPGFPGPRPKDGMWAEWHGYSADGFSSGTVIAVSDDGETYRIGVYQSLSTHTTEEEALAMAGPRDRVFMP